ncbi:MAG TPA: hypothetical protein VGZ23_10775 [bacterium]|nr:hypothetical protein [bacterium]
MAVYQCPECGHETVVFPNAGREIVARYCLRHNSGIDGHLHPVEMRLCPAADPAERLLREPVPVA